MKIGELTSFGHNIADSLASGICLMVGLYAIDIHGEASASPEGHILVDFMTGSWSGSPVSDDLAHAITRYSELLPELAGRHGLDIREIRTLSARFGTDKVVGRHFTVMVESSGGRRSTDQYSGFPGKRFSRPRRGIRATPPSVQDEPVSTIGSIEASGHKDRQA